MHFKQVSRYRAPETKAHQLLIVCRPTALVMVQHLEAWMRDGDDVGVRPDGPVLDAPLTLDWLQILASSERLILARVPTLFTVHLQVTLEWTRQNSGTPSSRACYQKKVIVPLRTGSRSWPHFFRCLTKDSEPSTFARASWKPQRKTSYTKGSSFPTWWHRDHLGISDCQIHERLYQPSIESGRVV